MNNSNNSICNYCNIIKNKDKFYNLDQKYCLECFNYNYLKDEIVLLKTAKYFNKNIKDIKLILKDLDDVNFNTIYIRYKIYNDDINIEELRNKIINNKNYKESYENLKKYNIKELFRLIRTAIYFEKSIFNIKDIINEAIDNEFKNKKNDMCEDKIKIYNWYNKTYPIDELINSI